MIKNKRWFFVALEKSSTVIEPSSVHSALIQTMEPLSTTPSQHM